MELPDFPGYRTRAELGKSGIRALYEVEALSDGRVLWIVALVSHLARTSPLGQSLLEEAELLERFEHPSFPALLDRSQEGRPWYAIPAAEGPTLDQVPLPLPWAEIRRIGKSVAAALAYAHEKNLFWGKLTPSELRLLPGGSIRIEVLPVSGRDDFSPLRAASRAGLAPEVILGEKPSRASDAWALGALLHRLLTGRDPELDGRGRWVPPRGRQEPKLEPPFARELCERLLEVSPEKRPASFTTLEKLFDEELPLAPKERASPRGQLYVAIALTALVGLTAGAWLFGRGFEREFERRLGGTASGSKSSRHPAPASSNLEPVRETMGLRVVASPWAHVYVDGTLRETTPFAEPILLPPGEHEVRLVHPHAPAEVRTIEGAPGQLVFLDIAMHLNPLEASSVETKLEDDTP